MIIYDDTFDGLCTAIFDHWRQPDCLICAQSRVSNLTLEPPVIIESDRDKAARVERWLETLGVARTVYRAQLHDSPDIDQSIVHYIRQAHRVGGDPSADLMDERVKQVAYASRFVSCEAGKYIQFTRFIHIPAPPSTRPLLEEQAGQDELVPLFRDDGFASKLDNSGLYIADIEPRFDILPLIYPHFTERFAAQAFVIRDRARRKAVMWDTREAFITDAPEIQELSIDEYKSDIERMWRTYFRVVAIPWRKNHRCQMQFVRLRFRKYMEEFLAEDEVKMANR